MQNFKEDFEKALAELLPAMEPDGGGAEIVSIEGRSAVLRLVGSCLFCPSKALSAAALEQGLRQRLPDLVDVRIVVNSSYEGNLGLKLDKSWGNRTPTTLAG